MQFNDKQQDVNKSKSDWMFFLPHVSSVIPEPKCWLIPSCFKSLEANVKICCLYEAFTDVNEGFFVFCNDKLQFLMILHVVTNGNSELSTSGREK